MYDLPATRAITHFNPRSPHGERRQTSTPVTYGRRYFNPRSPHGERLQTAYVHYATRMISIHAPRTGSDGLRASSSAGSRDFNPRSPHGERPFKRLKVRPLDLFQSTLPARGATGRLNPLIEDGGKFQSTLPARGATKQVKSEANTMIISIHAPRTGSDIARPPKVQNFLHFNPRSPHGERRSVAALQWRELRISIHAPRTGSDFYYL